MRPSKQRAARSAQRGGVLLEAVLGVSVFLILVFLTCETGLVFLRAATTQFVLSKEARSSLAYRELRGLTAPLIKQRIKDRGQSLGLDTTNWTVTICRAQSPNCTADTLGNGTDLLIIKVDPQLRIFGGSVPINFVASILISRESTV